MVKLNKYGKFAVCLDTKNRLVYYDHEPNNKNCPGCKSQMAAWRKDFLCDIYPSKCKCGGLIHAEYTYDKSVTRDPPMFIRCDKCDHRRKYN